MMVQYGYHISRMESRLLFLLVLNLAKAVEFQTSVPNSLPLNLVTYDSACLNECLCGVLSHPAMAALKGEKLFVPYQNNTKTLNHRALEQWVSRIFSTISFIYPLNVIFCLKTFNENMPEVDDGTVSNSFISSLGFIVMSQGRLKQVQSKDIEGFKLSLQYLDLSHNQIEFVENDAFQGCQQLQEIDLRFNNFHHLGSENQALTMGSWTRPTLRIRGNPIHCTCALMQTINNYVIIPSNDYACCTLEEVNSTNAENMTSTSLSRFNIAQEYVAEKLTMYLCHEDHEQTVTVGVAETEDHEEPIMPSYKGRQLETPHHTDEKSTNKSGTTDDHKVVRIYRVNTGIDVPLLLTMAAWFAMLYIGITKFIQANQTDREAQAQYFQKLDSTKIPTKQ